MPLRENQTLNHLAQMDEYRFEHLIADLWEARGWDTTVTTGSQDRGIDVIATKSVPFPQKQLIQAKRYARDQTIGTPAIQQYSSLKQQEDAVDAVIVVTTGSFTSPARELAAELNVKLIDGAELFEILEDVGAAELLKEYVSIDDEDRDQADGSAFGDRSETSEETRKTSISEAIGEARATSPAGTAEHADTAESSPSFYDDMISETPFNDSDDLIELPTTSDFLGDFCPICDSFHSIWSAEYENESKPIYRCDECGTTWRWRRALIRKSKWETVGGPQEGEKKTRKEWRKQ